ncbi:MAG TPA: DUF6077 domain-containing protein [Solirubrobacteraceae bacterium]|nr:DUF6077 domain-containing protein [Solirubrobacteraceae bacterium]
MTAAAAALLLAFASPPWVVVWALWIAAAALAVAWTTLRLGGRHAPATATARAGPDAGPGPDADPDAGPPPSGTLELAVVAAWAVGLAVLSLLLVNPDGDDAYYVHLSTWIAANGRFPLHDVVFSHDAFPSLYYPPAPSFEALAGTVARLTSLPAPDLVYLVVPPAASFLSVLAIWRLLRGWGVRAVAVAISVALLFLLFDAAGHRMPGSFFVGRMWQGKTLLLTLLLPVLLALLHDFAVRPSRRGLALLAAAAVAGVGLTTTAIFLVPVVAAGCLAPLALRAPRRAAAGLAAVAAYPAAAAVVTLAVDGRQPEVYTDADVIPANLVHFVFGHDVLALLGLTAVLLAPALLPRASAGQMLAGAALLVGLLFAPRVPLAIFHLTGLGRVLWRLTWALPVAALVGALAAAAAGSRGLPGTLRALPAAVVCAAVVLAGVPLWTAEGTRVTARPALKRPPGELAAARAILARARPGDVVLTRRPVSQTILVLSGSVTTVSPRGFYTRALRDVPAAHVRERLVLQRFSERAPEPIGPAQRRAVRRALGIVGVDVACVPRADAAARLVLRDAGFRDPFAAGRLACVTAHRAARRS